MKLTPLQLEELNKTGQVILPYGAIKRYEWRQKRYYNRGTGKFDKKGGVGKQYRFILDKELIAWLRVIDEV